MNEWEPAPVRPIVTWDEHGIMSRSGLVVCPTCCAAIPRGMEDRHEAWHADPNVCST